MFAFRGMPTFATAHTAYGDGAIVDALRQVQPVRWDNVMTPRTDSLPVQIARFRAGPDSVDVVAAAMLTPADTIKRSMEIVGDVRRYFWLVTPALERRASDASVIDTGGVYAWTHRVAQGSLVYRVEEFGETAKRAGRATGSVQAGSTEFPLHGFGISDLLIVGSADAPAASGRWNSLHAQPSAGVVSRGGQLSVLWENYEFAPRDGSIVYDAVLTLKREQSATGRISAQLAGVLANLGKRDAAGSNEVKFSFSRGVPAAPAFADLVTLALADTPAGSYSLTLDVTEPSTGRTASRTTHFVIHE
jgi:hypothetical protein